MGDGGKENVQLIALRGLEKLQLLDLLGSDLGEVHLLEVPTG
jgi:hypothetical protein